MKPISISPLFACLAMLAPVRSATADSDGYYCAGPNYLAYEMSFSRFRSAHYLFVIRLGDSVGIGESDSLLLPDFQVHGMRCGPGSLQLLGWDSLYTVDPVASHLSLTAARAPWAGQGSSRQPLTTYPGMNLGQWSRAARSGRADTTLLTIHATVHRFVLAITVQPDTTNDCRQHILTRVVELDQLARTVDARVLFDGEGLKECGE